MPFYRYEHFDLCEWHVWLQNILKFEDQPKIWKEASLSHSSLAGCVKKNKIHILSNEKELIHWSN